MRFARIAAALITMLAVSLAASTWAANEVGLISESDLESARTAAKRHFRLRQECIERPWFNVATRSTGRLELGAKRPGFRRTCRDFVLRWTGTDGASEDLLAAVCQNEDGSWSTDSGLEDPLTACGWLEPHPRSPPFPRNFIELHPTEALGVGGMLQYLWQAVKTLHRTYTPFFGAPPEDEASAKGNTILLALLALVVCLLVSARNLASSGWPRELWSKRSLLLLQILVIIAGLLAFLIDQVIGLDVIHKLLVLSLVIGAMILVGLLWQWRAFSEDVAQLTSPDVSRLERLPKRFRIPSYFALAMCVGFPVVTFLLTPLSQFEWSSPSSYEYLFIPALIPAGLFLLNVSISPLVTSITAAILLFNAFHQIENFVLDLLTTLVSRATPSFPDWTSEAYAFVTIIVLVVNSVTDSFGGSEMDAT